MGWLGGKPYRQQITIQEGNVFADHTDFPVALEISGANDVFTKAQANGYDVVLVSVADEVLDFERSIWNPGSNLAVFYVKTDLSSTEATVFYMYYGTPSGVTITTDPQNVTAVWDDDFVGVWHLEETPNSVSQDSTSNNNDLEHFNMFSNDLVDGVVGNGYNFDGSNDRLQKSSFSSWPTSAITAELVMSSSNTTKDCTTFSYAVGGSDNEFLIFNHTRSATIWADATSWNSGQSFNDGNWHQSVATWQSSNGAVRIFKDGVQAGGTGTISTGNMSQGGTLVIAQEQDSVGGGFNSDQAYLGNLDEIRISKIVRSDEWIQTTYENLVNNSSFFTLGAEEDTPYMLDDIPTVLTIEDSLDLVGTRNYITEFKVESTATVYYSDYWVSLSLADIVQTTSGIDDIDTSVGYLTDASLSDAENDEIVDFTISSSGTFGSRRRDTITQFTVALEPVPVTDPYGGTDVDAEFIRGIIVSNPIYGEDVSVEFYTFGTYDQSADTDVDFTLSTYEMFDYLTESIASTVSGTYGYPAYRQRITISGSKIEDDLVDFPVAVHITDGANPVFTRTTTSGLEVKFKKDDGWLDHELVNFDDAAPELLAYVKCTLTSGTDYTFHMYYGDYGQIEDSAGTWDGDFEAVYHMEEDPTGGVVVDSTEANDATPGGGMDSSDLVSSANTALSKCLDFDGNNDYLNAGTFNPSDTDLTIEFVHRMDQLASSMAHSHHVIVKRDNWSPTEMMWQIHIWNNDDTIAFATNSGWVASQEGRFTYTPPATTWQYIAITHDDGALDKLYVDGNFQESHSAITFDSDTGAAVILGNSQVGSTSGYDGKLDEMRISSVVRSSGWIKTTYNNLMDNANFFSELGVNEEFILCGGLGDEVDHLSHWCLADYLDTEVTVSGGLSYPIDVDVFASISGTQYNFETVSFASIANTYDGQMYDDPVTYSGIHYPLISGSYYDAEVTISGALWYPVEQDIYVSLADSVSGMPPVMPPNSGGAHSIDLTISGGNYINADMRLHALQIDNFFLDVDEYALSTSTMAVDITDRRNIQINTANCYFVIDGVTVTSGIYFTPVERTTASGYRMYYDPPGDFVADEPIEVIVHGENVINDWLEETYTLLWGYNLLINRGEFHSWGWDEEVVVWSKASNVARCPAESADAWHIRTAPQPYKDLAASIVPLVKRKDLSAVIYPISTAIFYGAKYKVTVNLKDLAGNEMPPFTLEFTVEDKP